MRILAASSPGEVRIAVLDGDTLTDYAIWRPGAPDGLGDVYRARITARVPAMAGAFVALPDGDGFLPDSEGAAGRSEGEIVAVRITRSAQGGKGPRLAAAGEAWAARAETGLVARGPNPLLRLAGLHPQACIWIDDAFLFARLRADPATPKQDGADLAAAQPGFANPVAAELGGADLGADRGGANLAAAQPGGANLAAAQLRGADPVAAHPGGADLGADRGGPDRGAPERSGQIAGRLHLCPRAFDDALEAEIDGLAEPELALPGGLRATVTPTPALTAIDVDGGASTARQGAKSAVQFAANRAALPALVRQIRLRNLSGAILVDLAGLPARRRVSLAPELAACLEADPARPRLLGFTRLGFAEILRPRHAAPLHELLAGPLAAGLAALRRVAAEPGRRARLRAAPAVAHALQLDPVALAGLARRCTYPLILQADPGLASCTWVIEDAR